jgi:hypothetical protein
MPTLSAQGRYERLTERRSSFLERARDAARVTLPFLIRESDGPPSGSDQYATPFQSVGARGVNNLAAKLLLALFPPGSAFFRMSIDPSVAAKIVAEGTEGEMEEIETGLVLYENLIMSKFESSNARPVLNQTLKHLIVAGNALLQTLKDGRLKMHPLHDYVVSRDNEGTILEIIFREGFSRDSLPEAAGDIVRSTPQEEDVIDDNIWVYTRAYRDSGAKVWVSYQEVEGIEIPDTRFRTRLDTPPYLALRWNVADGEDYGRGQAEEYLGDLESLESLSQSIVEFSAAAAKIIFMVDETGVTEKRDIEYAESGEIVDGRAQDVSVLQLEKFNDFRVAKETQAEIQGRLEQAFLLNSSIQRNAERVTAEEIRFMAGELESALGGVYSTLSQELQRPLVKVIEAALRRKGDLPKLSNVSPTIVTGLEGLGRQGDLMKLDLLISGIAQAFGPQAVAENINVNSYVTRRAAALGLDVEGIVKSDEQRQVEAQAAQQAEMNKAMAGPAVTAGGQLAAKVAEQPPQEA